jgi:cobalt-zinc-cadmium efflux system outer membrane protein
MPIRILCVAALAATLVIAEPRAQMPVEPAEPIWVAPADAPGLLALARDAVKRHPQVLAARAAVETRQAHEQAAERPLFNPELQLDVASSDTDDRSIGFSQALDIAGQRGARHAVAGSETNVAEAELNAERRQIATEILIGLAEYWTATGLEELAETRIDLMRSFADLARQRRQAGDLTQVELSIANLAYSRAQIEHASAKAARAGADQTLRAVVSTNVSSEWPILPVALPEISLEPVEIERLVAQLPETRAGQAAIATARARVDLRSRERRANPTLSFVAGEEDNESLIGLSFTMPLNIRNRYAYEVVSAQAEQTRAEHQAANIGARARQRLFAANERHGFIRDAWESWRVSGAPNLGQQTGLLERLVVAGELSTTDYLVQLDQTLDTAASALELRRQFWLAWFEWLAASGQTEAWLDLETED